MQYMMLMQLPYCVYQLLKDYQCFFFGKSGFTPQQFFKRPSFAVLIDKIDKVISLYHFYEFNNIEIILQKSQSLDLIFGKFSQFSNLNELVQVDHFDCHFYLGINMKGFKHLTILAFTQIISQCIVFYDFNHVSQQIKYRNIYSFQSNTSNLMRVFQTHKVLFLIAFLQFIVDTICKQQVQTVNSSPQTLKCYLFTQECYDTFFVHNDWLNVQCLKKTLVKVLGYAVVVGGSIVKLPQIIKIIKKKSTFGVSFSSVVFESFTQICAVAYNVARDNPFSVYGQTLLISIQMIIIHSLFIIYNDGKSGSRNTYFLSLLPVLGVFWASLNPKYFPSYVIQNALIVQMVLFTGARLLQIISVHKLKSTGSLSIITIGLSVLGNFSRLATALVEVADDLLYGLSVINAIVLNGYILLCFFIFKEKPEQKQGKKDK